MRTNTVRRFGHRLGPLEVRIGIGLGIGLGFGFKAWSSGIWFAEFELTPDLDGDGRMWK